MGWGEKTGGTVSHIDLMDVDAQKRALAEVTAPIVKPKPRRVTPSMPGEAPVLMIGYECGKCGARRVLDAYEGPPTCATGHGVEWMEGVRLVRASNPTADIKRIRG